MDLRLQNIVCSFGSTYSLNFDLTFLTVSRNAIANGVETTLMVIRIGAATRSRAMSPKIPIMCRKGVVGLCWKTEENHQPERHKYTFHFHSPPMRSSSASSYFNRCR